MTRITSPIRPLNKYGMPDDIAQDHGWVHSNIQMYGSRLPEIVSAFATDDPFNALGYDEDDVTISIAKWYTRPCKTDNSYLVSWESYKQPPRQFCTYLASTYDLNIKMEYTLDTKPLMPKEYFNWHKPIPQHHII